MIVPVHTTFGVIALAAGAMNLLRRKGTHRHRQIGWIYAGAMYALLFTSFFIYEAFGQFGVFHILSIFSGVTLTVALYFPLRRWHHPHWMAHHRGRSGAELSWIPADALESLGIERYGRWRFRQADGTVLERWTGPAFIHAQGKRATDDVVFGEPGNLVLLGARSLEGPNLRIDPVSRQLVDAGPEAAAAIA